MIFLLSGPLLDPGILGVDLGGACAELGDT
jgi:hypothetical protein